MFQPKTMALLRGLFAKDSEGRVYLRLADVAPEGELTNAVNTQSSRTLEDLICRSIVLDSNNNPALRITGVDFGTSIEEFEQKRRTDMAAAEKARKEALQASYTKKAEKE